MPDLGKYAIEVGLAYGVSLSMIALLVLVIWRRSVRVRHALDEVEGRVHARAPRPNVAASGG